MGDLGIIDRFLATFIQYIDSGFGLLGGEVGFLTTVLIGIDLTLAGLFWALDGETDIIARLVKKVLYVGAFALILNNFSGLAQILFDSFAGLGLTASGSGLTAADLLRPGQFTGALAGQPPGLADAMSLVLASIALFGLGIFGPGIAAGLVSGAPQLGAGAAIGTVGGLAAGAMAGSAAAMGLARAGGAAGLSAIRAGASLGSGAATAYQLGQATSGASGMAGIGAGIAGVARAGAGALGQGARGTAERLSGTMAEAATSGRQGAWRATGGGMPSSASAAATGSGSSVPPCARRLQSEQRFRAHTHIAAQAVKEGDRPGHGANPDLHQREQ